MKADTNSRYEALDKRTGNIVKPGDTVINFRGVTGIYDGPVRHKISVDGCVYYAEVWGLVLVEKEEDAEKPK